MDDVPVKVGFCVAYDWYFLEVALPLVYEGADVICLSIDRDHLSWTNQPFDWDEVRFDDFIRKIDRDGKINIYRDDFHLSGLTAMQNEVRQRNLMAHEMGVGGWHIQLDCDEYFMNFQKFVEFLRGLPDYSYPFNVSCPLITLYKRTDRGFLYVHPERNHQIEYFQIATKYPVYAHGRRNGFFNIYSRSLIIHQSWARSEVEIKQKLVNWGHVNDFDVMAYFEFWQCVDETNHKDFSDFHPIQPKCWPKLKFIGCAGMDEMIVHFQNAGFPTLPSWRLFLKNSRMFSRIRRLFKLTHGGAVGNSSSSLF